MACKWINDIFVLVLLTLWLLLEGIEGMVAGMVETSLVMHITSRIPCNHNFPAGSFNTARWTKSRSDDYYLNGVKALATWNDTAGVKDLKPSKYHMIDTDLSLVIKNVSLEDAGIYRCTVFRRNGSVRISDSDSKLSVYKQPDDTTVLLYQIQDEEIRFNCSAGTVFPEFPYPHQNNYEVRNKDGTHLYSISTTFQYNGKEIGVECSYSYQNQHLHSSPTTYLNRDGHARTTERGPQSSTYSTELSSTKGQNENHPPVRIEGYNSIMWLLTLTFLLHLVIVCKLFGLIASLRRWKNKKGRFRRRKNNEDEIRYQLPDQIKQKEKDAMYDTELGYEEPVQTKPKTDAQQEDTDSGNASDSS